MSTACACDDLYQLEVTQTLVSNSDINWLVTLLGADMLPLEDGIPSGSVVRYALLDYERDAFLIAPKTSSETDPDADWPNAKAVVRWDNVFDTAGLAEQDAWMEVKIGDQASVFRRIKVVKGLITA